MRRKRPRFRIPRDTAGYATFRLISDLARYCFGETAVAGSGFLYPLLALVQGLRHSERAGRGPRFGQLQVYHWERNIDDLKRHIAWMSGSAASERVLARVRYCKCSDDMRTSWAELVAQHIEAGLPPFSLVLHTGVGGPDDIDGDLKALWPAMGPDTIVILCAANEISTRRQIDRMRRQHGWDAVDFGELVLLQRPDHPKLPRQE